MIALSMRLGMAELIGSCRRNRRCKIGGKSDAAMHAGRDLTPQWLAGLE